MMTMKIKYILPLACLLTLPLSAQEEEKIDSTLARSVTVEREFQPIIQDAGKLAVSPSRIENQVEPSTLNYSTYADPLQANFNVNPLACSLTTFAQPSPTHNYLEGAIGHPLTRLHFNYFLAPRKNTSMNFYAHHHGQWGRHTWSDSHVGLNFQQVYSECVLYFQVDGKNRFYTHYGRYYNGGNGLIINHFSDFRPEDKTSIWLLNTHIGVRSRSGEALQYKVETGYNAYMLPSEATEHAVRTRAEVSYGEGDHKGGANIFVQNAFYSIDQSQHLADTLYNARHGIRIEPYYEYNGDAVRVHVGVNLDMNIGKGQYLSGNKDLSFAPSPNVDLEYRIIPEWLALNAGAKGSFSFGTLEGYLTMNPYLKVIPGITSHHVSGYTPVHAYLGFKIRPTKTFLIDVRADYALLKNQSVFLTPDYDMLYASQNGGPLSYLDYLYSDWQHWRVGAELTYHYQDIVHILLSGYYHKWIQDNIEIFPGAAYMDVHPTAGRPYDRPSWDIHLRIDARINSKWSLYSDNIFMGSRWGLTHGDDVQLRPTIDIRLGAQYEINSWLSVYLQLNNLLNRRNEVYYTYQTQGFNGLIGARWRF